MPPLHALPPELRLQIYNLCLISPTPISDPPALHSKDNDENETTWSVQRHIPPLGLSLLRSSKLIACEIDPTIIYKRNTFRFSTAAQAHNYLSSLFPWQRAAISRISISASELSVSKPEILGAWGVYLNFSLARQLRHPVDVSKYAHVNPSGLWTSSIGCLLFDAPNLKTLTLEFGCWARVGVSKRHLWDILRRMLMGVEGLERISLEGSCCGDDMCWKRVRVWEREPWSTAYFVGTEEVDGASDLIERMASAVGTNEDGSPKLVRWERHHSGTVSLEVVTMRHLRRTLREQINDLVSNHDTREPWPVNGVCTLDEYLRCKGRAITL